MQIAGDGGELVGAARVLVCTFTVDPQTFDLLVPNRECVDHGSRRKRCITWRALSKGRAYDSAANEGHGRSWTNDQLLHKWKVLPARAEIAIRRVNWWQAMTEHNHAHLQTIEAIWR